MLLVATVALAIMLAVPAIGLILVIALLTILIYLAELAARSLAAMMVTADAWSLAFCLTGRSLLMSLILRQEPSSSPRPS